MLNDLHTHRPGETFFCTVRLADRSSDLLVREINRLRGATRSTMARKPFRIDAICVLPSTIHTIWTLPPGDTAFSKRWSLLKSSFSQSLPMLTHHSEKSIWHRQHWEHVIRETADLETYITMIHTSPVHAGLCPRPEDWPHSSIHRARANIKPRAGPAVVLGAHHNKSSEGMHPT